MCMNKKIQLAIIALLSFGAAMTMQAQTEAEIEAAKQALLDAQMQKAQQNAVGTTTTVTTTTVTTQESTSPVVRKVMPQFPGGQTACSKFISDNMKYPEAAKQAKIEGRVMTSFYVNTDGTITDVAVSDSLSKECNEEAIRIIKAMPKWTPYTEYRQDGTSETVKCKMYLPIEFIFVARDYNRVNN